MEYICIAVVKYTLYKLYKKEIKKRKKKMPEIAVARPTGEPATAK